MRFNLSGAAPTDVPDKLLRAVSKKESSTKNMEINYFYIARCSGKHLN